MRKIPTLFQRNWSRSVPAFKTPNPKCRWVFDPHIPTVATEKFDGTSCRITDDYFWRRYTKEPRTPAPVGWEPAQDFPTKNGDYPGWVPVDKNSPDDQYHLDGLRNTMEAYGEKPPNGTYELVGPKVQGNPHNIEKHTLWRHGSEVLPIKLFKYGTIKKFLREHEMEGIVFYELGGDRMSKITRRDFGYEWPVNNER